MDIRRLSLPSCSANNASSDFPAEDSLDTNGGKNAALRMRHSISRVTIALRSSI